MNTEKPYFSLIIPTYERLNQLKKCLDSVTKLNYPTHKYEVIVIDDGSETTPEELIKSYTDKINISLLTQENSGPAVARNYGAENANGTFLAFTDDDCELEENWLLTFENEFTKEPDALLGGYTINTLSENPYSTASQELINYIYSYYNSDPDNATFFASNNIALRADLFKKLGGFWNVTTLRATSEDRELCDRWLYKGYKMIYTSEAIVFHSHPMSADKFWKQHFNYGRGAYYFRNLRAQRGQKKVKLEPLSFYTDLILYPFKKKESRNKYYISFLLVISQIANASGFYWETIVQYINKS